MDNSSKPARVETRRDEVRNVVVSVNGWELAVRIPGPNASEDAVEKRIAELVSDAYSMGITDGRSEVQQLLRAIVNGNG